MTIKKYTQLNFDVDNDWYMDFKKWCIENALGFYDGIKAAMRLQIATPPKLIGDKTHCPHCGELLKIPVARPAKQRFYCDKCGQNIKRA